MEDHQLEIKSQTIQNSCTECVPSLPKTTSAELDGWSDDRLVEYAGSRTFSAAAYAKANQATIVRRFLAFYITGHVNPKDNIIATVADMIALSRVEDKELFPFIAGVDCFYKLNDSVPVDIMSVDSYVFPSAEKMTAGMSEEQKVKYLSLTKTLGASDAERFIKCIREILHNHTIGEDDADRFDLLTRFCSFMALVLWRASTKTEAQLSAAVLKTGFITNIKTLTGWPTDEVYVPPVEGCIKMCVATLAKGTSATQYLVSKVAHRFVQEVHAEEKNAAIMGFLSASLLTHIARNGLGVIQLLDQVLTNLGTSWQNLASQTYLLQTSETWDVIAQFFLAYLVKGRIQYGYNWARVINDGYLRRLSPKENLFFSFMLAGALPEEALEGVLTSEWAKDKVDQYQGAIKIGKSLREAYAIKLSDVRGTAASMVHVRRAMEMEREQGQRLELNLPQIDPYV